MNVKIQLTKILIFLLFPFSGFSQNEMLKDTAVLNEQGRSFLEKKVAAKTYEEKIILLEKAIAYFQEAENWDRIIHSKSDLAIQYIYIQDQKKFDEILKDLRALLAAHTTSDDVYYFAKEILEWDAQLREDYETSEQLNREIFEYALKQSDKIRASRIANNIGFFYMIYVSDFERAIDYFQKAIRVLKESKEINNSQLAALYSNLGHCYNESGQSELAKKNLLLSLSILDSEDDQEINIQSKWWNYQNLADLYLSSEVYDSSFYYGSLALRYLEEDGKKFIDDYQTYHTLGDYYLETGEPEKAFPYLKKGLALAKEKGDIFRPTDAMVNVADALSRNQNHTAALDSLQQGIQFLFPALKADDIFNIPLPQSFVHKKSALKLIEKRAVVFYKKYKENNEVKYLKASFQNYQLVCDLINSIRQDYTGDVSKYFLAEKVLLIYESAIDAAFELYGLTGEDHYIEAAFYIAEQNKSVLLLESVRENSAKGFGDLPDTLLQKEKELKSDITLAEKKVYEGKKSAKEKDETKELEDNLFVLKEKYNDFTSEIEKQYPKYFELKYKNTIASVNQIQENVLDGNSVLLEYFVGEKNIFLFSVNQKKVGFFKIKIPNNFSSKLNKLRSIYSNPPNSRNYLNDLKTFNSLAFDLYNLLLRDALKETTSDHLIIIPDDLLIYLPFEILLSKNDLLKSFSIKDQTYLFEDFDISYSFSSSILLDTKDVFYQTDKDFVGFAPGFNNSLAQSARSCGEELYNLQCSEQEVSTISDLFEGETYMQAFANKNQFESVANNFNIIHLATHACIDEENPNFSKVFFTDDFLTNYDLANMEIKSNLAVLSACNTNVGPLMKGDGVSSISKGFLLAGCPSVLTSLWSVDDCSTSQIMINFYQHLKKGDSKSSALRKAKKDYLLQADNVNSHPYYWAPFLMSGNDRAIINNKRVSNIWYWTIGLFLILGSLVYFRILKK